MGCRIGRRLLRNRHVVYYAVAKETLRLFNPETSVAFACGFRNLLYYYKDFNKMNRFLAQLVILLYNKDFIIYIYIRGSNSRESSQYFLTTDKPQFFINI